MGSNLDTTKSVYDFMAKGDVGSFFGLMDENITWENPASMPFGNQTGPQAIGEEVLGPTMAVFPDFNMTVNEFHDAGDTVFVVGTYHGTGAETGQKLEADFVHVWRFAGGKISYHRSYTDTHVWLQAMGKA